MNLVLVGILLYVAAQLVVGMLVSRRIASEEDYLLAGRSFGFGLATFSFFATWFGAETCIGAAGRIYEHGFSGGSADPFGYGACLFLMGLIFAVPLWRRRLTTLADLFRLRYSAGVERLAVIVMVPSSVLWAAAQIRAFGQVLESSAGMNVALAITIAAGVAVIYTAFGGMRADVITDLIQGIMIIIGLVVLVVVVIGSVENWPNAWAAIESRKLNPIGLENRPWFESLEAWAIPICGSVVAQELVARVLATRSAQIARRAALCGGGLYLVIGLIPAGLGLFGATLMPGLQVPEQFLPALAQKHLGYFAYVLFAGALVSAILSTVDSTLLAASSLTAHNLIIPLRPRLTERGKVTISRAGVVVFGIIAWWLALQAETIYSLVESASSIGSAGILVLVVMGLFTRLGRMNSAYTALVLGTGVWIVGSILGWRAVYLISLAAALAGYLVVSIFERRGQAALIASKPATSNQH